MEYPQDNGPAFRVNWPQIAIILICALVGCLMALLLFRMVMAREITAYKNSLRRPKPIRPGRTVSSRRPSTDDEDEPDDDDESSEDELEDEEKQD